MNAAGRTPFEIWLNSGVTYKFALYTSTNVLIGTYDNIPAIDDPTVFNNLITVTGTNTLLGVSVPPYTSYVTGMTLSFVPANTNSGAVTLDLDGLGAKNVFVGSSTALIGGELVAGRIAQIQYDGTRFQLYQSTNVIADGSITTAKLANGAATGAKLGSDVIQTTGAQTIGGAKTFTSPITFNDATQQNTAYLGSRGQAFTANGTFTIPTGVTAIKATIVGGGGGTGGSTAAACVPSSTSGGGGGGTCVSYLTGLTSGLTIIVTIGGAGTAGLATPTSGTAGGNTTLTSGTQSITTVTAGGGGGTLSASSEIAIIGGTAGSATNGTVNIPGQKGQGSPSSNVGGFGGSSTHGFGGTQNGGFSSAQVGTGYGAGGSGSAANGGTSAAGAAGTAGLVIFEW
jgi:hypothetical protein